MHAQSCLIAIHARSCLIAMHARSCLIAMHVRSSLGARVQAQQRARTRPLGNTMGASVEPSAIWVARLRARWAAGAARVGV